MIAHSVLGQTLDNVVLLVAVAAKPVLHVCHHFALDLRVAIMEIGVEET